MLTQRRPNRRISDSTAWASTARVRKLRTTSAPVAANDNATERPIPRLAPVTRATLPFRSFILLMVHSAVTSCLASRSALCPPDCPVSRLAGVGMHLPRDLLLFLDSGFAEVVALLQIQP